jgi:hypothetical protein
VGYDPIDLRPATVEELAARERASAVPRHARPARGRPVIVITIIVLLMAGAGVLALVRGGSTPTIMQPYGPDAPFGVGYVDGFGEHSPKPTSTRSLNRKPATASTRAAMSGPVSPGSAWIPGPAGTAGTGLGAAAQGVTAVWWTSVAKHSYETYIWVYNQGPEPLMWEVQVTLHKKATVTGSMAVNHTFVNDVWVFTPTRAPLGGGMVYLFGFSGSTVSGKFGVTSCTVNGSPCVPFI